MDIIKAIRAAADRETRALPTYTHKDAPIPTLTAKVGSCGRFIMGYVGDDTHRPTPSRLCGNASVKGRFCPTCTNYVRFVMHRAIPEHWARENYSTIGKEEL